MVAAANGLARILKAEGVEWVSTFPVCCVNNALGQEGMPMIMMRDERYAVAVADAFSRVTNRRQIGVCTVMGGLNAAGLQIAYGALAQAFEDPLCGFSEVDRIRGNHRHHASQQPYLFYRIFI